MIAAPANSVAYHQWQAGAIQLHGRRYRYATKPGAFSHGVVDPATRLLAQHVHPASGDVVAVLNCGNGLFGAVAAGRGASRVCLSDRNVVSCEAARRTLEENAIVNGDVWLGQGTYGFGEAVVADLVAIRIPHEKPALIQLLHDAWQLLRVGGRCVVAGATNEGAKSASRLLELLFGQATVLASAGGHRLVVAVKRDEPMPSRVELSSPYLAYDAFHEMRGTLRGIELTVYSRPGVFSWEHVDDATMLLADVMDVRDGESVLDLGCGAGALGTIAGLVTRGGAVTMVDADVEAVRSAIRTAHAAGIANVRALTSDIASAVQGERFDVVVSNPPFHIGKATALNVPMQFMRDAHAVLRPGGRAYFVANRTLPYEPVLMEIFGAMQTMHDGPRFKVLSATKRV